MLKTWTTIMRNTVSKSGATQGILSLNIYECVCCYEYSRCHGNAVKGFWVVCILSVCWLVIFCR
jgi:hypothetical protein